MKNTLLMSVFCMVANMSMSQNFRQLEVSTVKPGLIVVSSYVPADNCGLSLNSEFDISNPYSFLTTLQDELGKIYQFLYQTTFSGKLTYLSYSQNLSDPLKCRPYFFCCSCIRKTESYRSDSARTDAVLECLLQHLNSCQN